MKHRPNFNRGTKEFEPINEAALYNKSLIEDYKSKEVTRTSSMSRLIYDCNEVSSPYYTTPSDFINPADQIQIPNDKSEAQIGNFYLKGS